MSHLLYTFAVHFFTTSDCGCAWPKGFQVIIHSIIYNLFNQNNFIDLFTNLEQDNIKSIIFSINQHLGKNSLKTLSDLKLDKKAKSKGIKFIKEDVMLQKNNGKEYK